MVRQPTDLLEPGQPLGHRQPRARVERLLGRSFPRGGGPLSIVLHGHKIASGHGDQQRRRGLPFDLDEILERALREEVAPGVVVPFLGLDDLVAMKLEAGRPQDLVDAEKLRRVAERSGLQ
jgi:hypothetical protein